MKRPPAVTALIDELKRMPGIGQKTAERLSFFLMRGSSERANKLADAIRNVKEKIILVERGGETEDEVVFFSEKEQAAANNGRKETPGRHGCPGSGGRHLY